LAILVCIQIKIKKQIPKIHGVRIEILFENSVLGVFVIADKNSPKALKMNDIAVRINSIIVNIMEALPPGYFHSILNASKII
jgi:hypothetical protein